MSKRIWISMLEKDEEKGKNIYQTATKYGLQAGGHFWSDDLEKMEWAGALPELANPETGLWIIKGTMENFNRRETRFGLAMLALCVQAKRGHGFPILLVPEGGELDPATLPTPLRDAQILEEGPALGAKLAAKANIPMKKVPTEYRLTIHALTGLGQWFEIGPAKGHTWNGALLGITGGVSVNDPADPEKGLADIDAHGVGDADKLPERSVLNYPMQGLKLNLGDTEYTGWAVQNPLDDKQSYFLRVTGTPDSIVLGELPQGDDGELFTVQLV